MSSSAEPSRSFETAPTNEERSFIDVELSDMSQRHLTVQPKSHYPADLRQKGSNWRARFHLAPRKHSLAHHDNIEELLAESISSDTQSSARLQHLRRLQSEYKRFKGLPGQWSPSKNTVVSCNHLLSHWVFSARGEDDGASTDGKPGMSQIRDSRSAFHVR